MAQRVLPAALIDLYPVIELEVQLPDPASLIHHPTTHLNYHVIGVTKYLSARFERLDKVGEGDAIHSINFKSPAQAMINATP